MPSTKLTGSIGELDLNAPIFFEDIIDFTLVNPGTDYYMPNSRHLHGVYFRSARAGTFTCVTLFQYMDNGGDVYRAQSNGPSTAEKEAVVAAAISAGDTVTLQLEAGQWSDTAIAFIDATSAADTALNVGLY